MERYSALPLPRWHINSNQVPSRPVWHGTQEKYQIFDTLGGRFNSEFGMEAFPHIDTIKAYCTDPSQLYPQSHMLDFHNKADGHERRIATYLVENFRTVTDLEVRTKPYPMHRSIQAGTTASTVSPC
jgi:hypothetical protein